MLRRSTGSNPSFWIPLGRLPTPTPETERSRDESGPRIDAFYWEFEKLSDNPSYYGALKSAEVLVANNAKQIAKKRQSMVLTVAGVGTLVRCLDQEAVADAALKRFTAIKAFHENIIYPLIPSELLATNPAQTKQLRQELATFYMDWTGTSELDPAKLEPTALPPLLRDIVLSDTEVLAQYQAGIVDIKSQSVRKPTSSSKKPKGAAKRADEYLADYSTNKHVVVGWLGHSHLEKEFARLIRLAIKELQLELRQQESEPGYPKVIQSFSDHIEINGYENAEGTDTDVLFFHPRATASLLSFLQRQETLQEALYKKRKPTDEDSDNLKTVLKQWIVTFCLEINKKDVGALEAVRLPLQSPAVTTTSTQTSAGPSPRRKRDRSYFLGGTSSSSPRPDSPRPSCSASPRSMSLLHDVLNSPKRLTPPPPRTSSPRCGSDAPTATTATVDEKAGFSMVV